MILRAPQFGSTQEILTFEISKRTTHDQLSQARPTGTDVRNVFKFVFEALTDDEKDTLTTFLLTNRAKRVTLTDLNDIAWFGFITNGVVSFTRTHVNPCNLWATELEFEGVPV